MDSQLGNITKTAYETAETTNLINKKLRDQRDKITTATSDIKDANRNVNVGKKIINEMTRKECCYKAMLYMVIIVLFAVIVTLGIVIISTKL